jgi:Zn finger protein HypA/HybF involved in hydrogenase expression
MKQLMGSSSDISSATVYVHWSMNLTVLFKKGKAVNVQVIFENQTFKISWTEFIECHLIGNKNPGDCCHMTCPQCETVNFAIHQGGQILKFEIISARGFVKKLFENFSLLWLSNLNPINYANFKIWPPCYPHKFTYSKNSCHVLYIFL